MRDDDDSKDAERPLARRPRRRRDPSRGECPKCGSEDVHSGPWPWYLGTVGAMLCRAMECEECGHEYDANKPHANLAARKRNLAIIINGIGGIGILIVLGLLFLALHNSMGK